MRYAVRNIGRLKARSALMFILALVILFLSMFGIMTNMLCRDSRARFYGPLDGSVYVTDDDNHPFLSYRAASYIRENSGVISDVSAVREYDVVLTGLDYIGRGMFLRNYIRGAEKRPESGKVEYIKGFRLCAVTSMDILKEVYGGKLYMTGGTMISARDNADISNKIVISDKLAAENGLKIGDAVKLSTMTLFRDETETAGYNTSEEREQYSYIIGGIYHNSEDNLGSSDKPWLVNDNRVYVPISTVCDISETDVVQNYYRVTFLSGLIESPLVVPDTLYFHLSDIGVADALETELNGIGFAKNIKLTKYMSDSEASPSARLSGIISVLTAAVVTLGFAVFILTVFFNVNARKRELAVLCALGKKRGDVSLSFSLEIFVLAVAALLCGLAVFAVSVRAFAVPITSYLDMAEISSKVTSETADFVLLGSSGGEWILRRMESFSYLLSEYILPAFALTAAFAAGIVVGSFIFVSAYVKRINPLSAVGGKE